MTLSTLIVTMLVSYLLPAAVALLTKSGASAGIKQFINALLAAATGLITTATTVDGTAVLSKTAVVLALGAFIASQAAYVSLYRPHAVNAKVAPGVGLG